MKVLTYNAIIHGTIFVCLLAVSTAVAKDSNDVNRIRRSNLVLTTTESPMHTFTTSFSTMEGEQTAQLTLNSVDSFFDNQRSRLTDPASSIFVSNAQDDEASENMARYFFYNSNVGTYNTSVSFTIPLFSFSMPDFSGSLLNDLGVSTLFTLASLGILFFGGLALLPYIFAYYGAGTLLPFFGGRSMDSSFTGSSWMPNHPYLNYLADSIDTAKTAAAVEAAIAKFATLVGDQCAKRTVCEAHSKLDTEEDNLLCTPIRALFPLPDLETGEYLEDMTLTPFQVAALYGRSKDANCGDQYRLCFFSHGWLREVVEHVVNFIQSLSQTQNESFRVI